MSEQDRHSEPQLPPTLADELAGLFAVDQPVPAEVDQAILAPARRRFTRQRRVRLVARWVQVGTAAAAAAVLLGLLVITPFTEQSQEPSATGLVALQEDIDQNGKVDILDAFTLARRIEADDISDERWDFNGDGLIDRADVHRVAMSAVTLDRGSYQ